MPMMSRLSPPLPSFVQQARVSVSTAQSRFHHNLSSLSNGVKLATKNQRMFHSSPPVDEFHFDTHHFVQRLEREGLNRQQAEGIMTAMAEVIDESIRNMTSSMVTKADQEKVSPS